VRPIAVSVILPAPPEAVWEEVGRLDRHVEWMADARSIRFLGDGRSGVGTRLEVKTRLGPLRTRDTMEVIEWEPPRRIGVEHRGPFTGRGSFHLEPAEGGRTLFTWEERVLFPWYFGGPLGALAARPVFLWVWRRNLRRLCARFTAP